MVNTVITIWIIRWLHNIKDKSNIWNVNTEKEYHEEKS